MAGAAGIEPTTLGLEDLGSPRPTIRIQSVTVGEPTSQSGKFPSFGHEYAPVYAPLQEREKASSREMILQNWEECLTRSREGRQITYEDLLSERQLPSNFIFARNSAAFSISLVCS